jgi:hypothetical protein
LIIGKKKRENKHNLKNRKNHKKSKKDFSRQFEIWLVTFGDKIIFIVDLTIIYQMEIVAWWMLRNEK